MWPEGHAPTNYTRWFNSSHAYRVSWQQNYEPYIAVSRDLVPKYDERFFGFGWNKVSHIMEVDAQGYVGFWKFSTSLLTFLMTICCVSIIVSKRSKIFDLSLLDGNPWQTLWNSLSNFWNSQQIFWSFQGFLRFAAETVKTILFRHWIRP